MGKKYETPTMESIEITPGGIIAASCNPVDQIVAGCTDDSNCGFDNSGGCPLVLCASDNVCSQNVPGGR